MGVKAFGFDISPAAIAIARGKVEKTQEIEVLN